MANIMLNHPEYYHYKPVFGMQNTSNERDEATSVPIERVAVATASGKDSEAVQMVSICQWHISIKKFMLPSLENANTNINVHYMTKNLVRSFVRTCSRKSPPSHHHHHHYHHRRQGSIARTAGRHFWGGATGRDICPADVAPIARGLRRTTPWTPSRWVKRCSNILWYVSVTNPASYHIQNITSVKKTAPHIPSVKRTPT